jgi:Xaa-Pro aminopeptidase
MMNILQVDSRIDYKHRRQRTLNILKGSTLLVLSQPESVRNATTHHPYRQDSFLAYLTGFYEPNSALVVASHRQDGDQSHLFLRENDLSQEIWTGQRMGVVRAQKELGVDHVHSIDKLWSMLPELLKGTEQLYAQLGMTENYDRQIISALFAHKQKVGKMGRSALIPLCDAREISGLLRLKKGPEEQVRLREAARITHRAFQEIMAKTAPGMNERQIHALLLSIYLAEGAEMEAYPAIVAGGERGFYLHYQENNQIVNETDLVLVDSGCQFQYYCCDVTRTFPVGKKFTTQQKEIYELVLKAQKEAITMAVPGNSLEKIHKATVASLSQGLIDLGVLVKSLDQVIEQELYKPFYPHGTSHWIGMDVHDVGLYYRDGRSLPLEEGMYFSVEPGLYFNPQDSRISPHWRGISVRIEDDLLIGSTSSEVVTASIPKDIKDLESLRAGA